MPERIGICSNRERARAPAGHHTIVGKRARGVSICRALWYIQEYNYGPVAQLGARFHGMEEVVSSNLTRSTKTFHRLTRFRAPQNIAPESNWSPKPILSTGSHGHRVDFDTCPRSSQPIQGDGKFGHRGHRLSVASSSS